MDIHRFLDAIAYERLAGSDGEKRARNVIVEHITRSGVEAVEEPFALASFRTGRAEIKVASETVVGAPIGLSPTVTCSGRLVLVEHAEALGRRRGAYRDCIVMTYGWSRRLPELLAICGASAALCIGGPDRAAPSLAHRQHEQRDGRAVSLASISYDDALRILPHIGTPAHLWIDHDVQRREAANVIATVGAPRIDETVVYVTAHYDSVHSNEGAADNAAGVACALSLLEHFAADPPEREMRFLFCSGEELGLLGSRHHVEVHTDDIDRRVGAVVNIDISGDPIGTDYLHVSASKEAKGYLAGLLREAGFSFAETLSLYNSDGIPFLIREIPAINLARSGGKASAYVHTPGDVMSLLSDGRFDTTIDAGRTLLRRLTDAQAFPLDRGVDESLREPLERQLWELTHEPPQLCWTPPYRRS